MWHLNALNEYIIPSLFLFRSLWIDQRERHHDVALHDCLAMYRLLQDCCIVILYYYRDIYCGQHIVNSLIRWGTSWFPALKHNTNTISTAHSSALYPLWSPNWVPLKSMNTHSTISDHSHRIYLSLYLYIFPVWILLAFLLSYAFTCSCSFSVSWNKEGMCR